MQDIQNAEDEELGEEFTQLGQRKTCDWGRMMNNIHEYLFRSIMPEVCQTKNSRKAIKRAAKEYILIDEKLYKKIQQKSSSGVTGTFSKYILFWAYACSPPK